MSKKKKTDNATAANTNQKNRKRNQIEEKRHGKSKAEEEGRPRTGEQVNEAATNEDAQEAITATE